MGAVSAVAAAPVVAQAVLDSNAITTIINNINSLYSNIFTFVAVLVTLGGIAFPVIFTRYQNSKFESEQNRLSAQITTELAAAKENIRTEIKNELEQEKSVFDGKISELKVELIELISSNEARAEGKAHFLQAVSGASRNNYTGACKDYLLAIRNFVRSEDEGNMKSSINNLLRTVLPKITKKDFEDNDELEQSIVDTIERIESINSNGRYDSEVKEIKAAVKAAKSREANAVQPKKS